VNGEGFIFWKRPLRVAGPASAASAAARLGALLAGGRFGLTARLVGVLDGSGLRVWRRGPLAGAGDAVQFEGTLRAEANGTVIEGTLCYKLATRIQFVGLLGIAALLLAAGAFQSLAGADAGADLLAFAGILALAALAWIYASSRMRDEEIRFIENKLSEAVA
jgi:hypothetical protein